MRNNIITISNYPTITCFVNLLADGMITHEEYQESIEATNKDLTELMEQKNELLSLMESEDVIETMEKLKKELLQFLNFDELTEDILHRLINRIEVKEDGTPKKLNRGKKETLSCLIFSFLCL